MYLDCQWCWQIYCKEHHVSWHSKTNAVRHSWSIQFKQSDGPRTAYMKQQIFSETQGSQSVNKYYTKIKQLWEELKNHEPPYRCCCGRENCESYKRLIERDEQYWVLKFLMGLSDTYTATRGQILMMEPKPSITKVFNLVSQEERQCSMIYG